MNLTLSLIIYNPLEALVLILFVTSLLKDKFTLKKLNSCFVLGAINLLFQYPSKFFDNSLFIFIYDIVITLIVMSFTLYIYYFYTFHKSPKIFKCFLACLFNFITIYIGVYVSRIVGITDIIFSSKYSNLITEFSVNMIIKIVQFISLFIIKFGVDFYNEKNIKKNCN